jgi:hypothetical protein
MATLAGFLKGELGRPVFDKTGIEGIQFPARMAAR